MRLQELAAGLPDATVTGDGAVEVTAVDYDSRSVHAGALFCCISGARADGHQFADHAVARGAVALMVERQLAIDVPQVRVGDVRAAMALAAAAIYRHPSRSLDVVGVTGTNGKTTTVHLLRNIFEEDGRRTRIIGTLSGPRTTPEAPDLQRQLAAWRDEGVTTVAMEVSSHAIALHRVDATRFRVSVFTNLSPEHLDFHGSMNDYFASKAELFVPERSERAVVNLDSSYGRLLRDTATIPVTGFTLEEVDQIELHAQVTAFRWRSTHVELPLAGTFNLSNALGAAHAAAELGIATDVIAAGLSRPLVVPGRFELIDRGQPFSVVVDYAHTPDALERVLEAASELVPSGSSVAVVFGCGGERDSEKRPLMGRVAARGADRVVLTADNSRGESTAAIIEAVKAGFDRATDRRATELVIEPDRRTAIAGALAAAAPGDVVVIAGKGHEETLTIGDEVIAFDDRDVARAELDGMVGSR